MIKAFIFIQVGLQNVVDLFVIFIYVLKLSDGNIYLNVAWTTSSSIPHPIDVR